MNDKTLYLHIGTHKTGSSAIQAFMGLNSDRLKQKGFYYPIFNKNSQLFQTSSGNGGFLCSRYPNFNALNRADILENLSSGSEKVILSCEGLFVSSIDDFKILLNYFSSVKIICYLRRQDIFFQSAILQMIKSEKHDDINNHIHDEYAFYSKKLDELKDLFGIENIIVRPYEKQQFINEDLIADFLSIFKIEYTIEYLKPDKIINPSLNRDFAEIKRICNKLPFDKNLINSTFLEPFWKLSVQQNGGKAFSNFNIYSPQKRIEIIKKYAQDNERIAREYLGRKDGRLFYDPIPNIGDSWEPYKEIPLESIILAFGYLHAELSDQISRQEAQIEKLETNSKADEINLLKVQFEKLKEEISISDKTLTQEQQKIETIQTAQLGSNEVFNESYNFLSQKLGFNPDSDKAEIYRDLALFLEQHQLFNAAYYFMRKALEIRPNGPLIKKKVMFLEQKNKMQNNLDKRLVNSEAQLKKIYTSQTWLYGLTIYNFFNKYPFVKKTLKWVLPVKYKQNK